MSSRRPRATLALALLFGVNFLNYIDRNVISAVVPHIQTEFHLGDREVGLIGSMFMVVYALASPLTGVFGDRWPRRYLVGAGVVLWSVATVLSGLARSFHQLLGARSLIGVGEAGFGAVAPGLISDMFPRERRGRMLAYFYVAIPVGSALGYVLGGWIGEALGWRNAFYIVGAPGILLGLAAFSMYEPPRGISDGVTRAQKAFNVGEVLALVRNRSFVLTTLGMGAMTFALAGMAYWMPSFLVRRGMPLAQGNLVFGGITVVAGLLGTFLGGWLGDLLLQRTPRAYLLVSGMGMLLAAPVGYVALTSPHREVFLPCFFVAELLVFLNTGPANATLVNVVLPEIRTTAIAASIFTFHVIGDVPSPLLIGWFSERSGSLEKAMLLAALAMLASGAFYLWGARFLAEDTARVAQTVAQRERDALPS
jgi:MFS transporter, Spinster family, sphingosine-1-phosphate transporter